ncbi:DNA methyltransferase [Tepidanaerobacter syntrophicus]|uniref:DNA methylase n=1 Tax=Tepidanaerobacter syntrophicus TaxID=224999 RepID=A0A0U9HGA8_9FIRM|nr:DNA methyltransferase [Tepidanaerobacter syntrophicus]GAQ25890.1 DNA methylase [Tepidanaerobacter syntrophicus]
MKLTKEILDKVRNIEGFPLGKDEDIIALSDPPYYTACPNPFIGEFIEKYGTSYDESTDEYNVEPYTADVSEGKNDPIYNAHSYHTKVPHKAIMRYILHYTKPGDIVFDGFCGTGMTGVAAAMCENPDEDFKIKLEQEAIQEGKTIEWGARRAVLCDLSPAATFIAYNYNTPVDVEEFEKEAKRILEEMEDECSWMYETNHTINGTSQLSIDGKPMKGRINYTVWSDVFLCPNCMEEMIFWNIAVNKKTGKVLDKFHCPHCGLLTDKRNVEKARVTIYDKALGKMIEQVKQVPVMINYSVGRKRFEKTPDEEDLKLLQKIEEMDIPYWYPTDRMPEGYNTEQPKKSHGITHVHHFYTKRNLWVLSALFFKIKPLRLKFLFTSLLTRSSKQARFLAKNYFHGGGGWVGTSLPGTLFIPSLNVEVSPIFTFKNRISTIKRINAKVNSAIVTTSSAAETLLNANTIDYIFTDPPFGANLMYSELNFLWEAWLKVFTNNESEAIINKTQGKGLVEYQRIMERCFKEMHRILKPGRWMTVEFHNSKNSVWNAIQEAIMRAGFVVANVRSLDKQQGSFKQVTTTMAVKQDLIISAYKPKDRFVQDFVRQAGTEEGVWNFVRQHLERLPVTLESGGRLDVIPERQNYLLYDSMVAYHIQRGATVPMGAADFYQGLKQRFPERDGMYFLPDQVSKYEQKRMELELNEQLSFLILDEKTAIQWLRQELSKEPKTYQDIQPKFLQELKQLRHENMPELGDLLQESFLQDEKGRWYVPDTSKQSDLEKLRERRLLKDFEEYKTGRGKLRYFRTEAVRAGFKDCWSKKDYNTIVKIGERLPESVLQEDTTLLMYYDNALTRLGD